MASQVDTFKDQLFYLGIDKILAEIEDQDRREEIYRRALLSAQAHWSGVLKDPVLDMSKMELGRKRLGQISEALQKMEDNSRPPSQ